MVRFVAALLAVVVLAACGTERNMDNPDPIGPGSLETSTTSSTTTLPTITAFVPSTAPTTLAPVTAPPTNATYAPTTAPPAPPTPLPTSATLPPVATIAERYTVVAGDTLSGIARKLGVTLDALLSANGFTASSLIRPGDQLAIPARNTATNPPATNTPATNPPVERPGHQSAGDERPGDEPAGDERPGDEPAGDQRPRPDHDVHTARRRGGTGLGERLVPGAELDRGERQPDQLQPAERARPQPGDGVAVRDQSAQTLTFTFPAPVHLTSVGLIGGYVKSTRSPASTASSRTPGFVRCSGFSSTGTSSLTATQEPGRRHVRCRRPRSTWWPRR